MGFPEFYDPDRVGKLFEPDVATSIEAGMDAGHAPAARDAEKRLLLLVDEQVDFVHSDGALSVPGAVQDTQRLIEWMFKHMGEITQIAASLDSHLPLHVFFATWWVDEQGIHPAPYTSITQQDVEQGRWQPVYEMEWSLDYVRRLQAQARKDLMIWPYHTMIGTQGHAITPALYEVIAYHAAARRSNPEILVKGTIAKTEFYSIFEPEVKATDDPLGNLNVSFLETLTGFDQVYIAGQAKSHCVMETIHSLMKYFGDRREIVERMHVLMDCTSSVQHPEVDFDAMAQEALLGFEGQGLRLVTTADPL